MNIPIEQLIQLRETIEQGAKGLKSLPLGEVPAALHQLIGQASEGMNRVANILIVLEEDELTEQCGVNTSNSFNTPPEVVPGVGKTQTPDPKFTPKPPGELDPETWKCNETEPRESTPMEKLIDTVKMVFERYPHLRNRLPIAMLTYAEEAQAFLDADTCLRERIKELEEELDGEKTVKTVLRELAKRLQADLNEERENKTD